VPDLTLVQVAATLRAGESAGSEVGIRPAEEDGTVVASEFAFLILGLVLGIPTGAALVVVIRARPPAPREVRLTVAPDSVPRRRPATLSGDPFTRDDGLAARGGPADRAWYVDDVRITSTDVPPGPRPDARPGPVSPGRVGSPATTARTPVRNAIGVTVDGGVDPMITALHRELAGPGDADRSPPPAKASATGAPATAMTAGASRTGVAGGARSANAGATRPVAGGARSANAGIALLERAIRERAGSPASATATATTPDPAERTAVAGPEVADPAVASLGGPAQPPGGPVDSGALVAAGPCADERRAVAERCALADRMRTGADEAAETLRTVQDTHDRHRARADAAAEVADARAQRAAKDAAQRSFRRDRAKATSRDAVETAARTWLQEINRINTAAREATALVESEREAAAELATTIERLTMEADVARIRAEAAQSSCHVAREALAECQEAADRDAAVAAAQAQPPSAPDRPLIGADESLRSSEGEPGSPAVPGEPAAAPSPATRAGPAGEGLAAVLRSGASIPSPDEENALVLAAANRRPAILRLLAGDSAAMRHLVAALAGDDRAEQRRWQLLFSDLVDAIVARAIEACAFDFPDQHPFWSGFSPAQNRDIALALSSLGFRFDGLGGFADERVPSQRDVSLALGYAGLDPMRLRRWPTEAAMGELYRDVTVAADEYLVGVAPALTLGQLVALLGRRADALAELWNEWGHVRPLLLASA
jgi:hypothetical protein